MNYVAMSKFFKGLSQTGAWCCFDEFNRIQPEVLSVVAEQIRSIQKAIREKRNQFSFEGQNIRLVRSCAINITMNPGYEGRSELPDNLKALFRPCAMMIPNYSLIAEISLYSAGFQQANSLATKVVGALRLSSEQLSSQKHYDFGMRALKAILVAAGALKREAPYRKEAELVLQALKDVNLPKFTINDVPLFNSIIKDLFPGVAEPTKDLAGLLRAMKDSCTQLALIPKPEFLSKCLQLHETTIVRHGLMLVGDTRAGKSSCWKVLQKGLEATGQEIQINVLNPKAVTGAQLYGWLDPDTKTWSDGVLPYIMKECERQADVPIKRWVLFDGPVDAVWIENMNTVLDDNKILCLTNGQKIRLTSWMNMIFEVEELSSASPATVSRCGMIFLDPSQLGWPIILRQFIDFQLSPLLTDHRDTFDFNLQWLLYPVMTFVSKNCKLPLKLNQQQILQNVIEILKILISEIISLSTEGLTRQFETRILDLCLFSVLWGVGGLLEKEDRQKLNIFLLKMIYMEDVRDSYDISFDHETWKPRGYGVAIGDCKDLFKMQFQAEGLKWDDWGDDDVNLERFKNLKFEEIIVPTRESKRNEYFIASAIRFKRNILLTGPTGTGKSLGITNVVDTRFAGKDFGTLRMGFSGQTSANGLQRAIEARMNSRRGKKGVFGPEEGKKQMVIFIDDLSMPAKEKYGAQPPLELLRMWLDHGFWYNLETLETTTLIDMSIAATMGSPSSGRPTISPRVMSHFILLYVTPFEQDSLERIFDSLLEWKLTTTKPKFLPMILQLKEKIVRATIQLYDRVKTAKELLPIPSKSHYVFSLRDISRVFQSFNKTTYRSFRDEQDMYKLWAHECTRVFGDRLVNATDRATFSSIVKSVMTSYFGMQVDPWKQLWSDQIPVEVRDKNGKHKMQRGVYTELVDRKDIKRQFRRFIEQYNGINADTIEIVLFEEAIKHVLRVVRVITMPQGHLLFVGLGGLGRKLLLRLAAFIAGFELKSVERQASFGVKEWREGLVEVMRGAGISNKKTVFMMKDGDIQIEEQLQDINDLLTTSRVEGLFEGDEMARLMEDLASPALSAKTESMSKGEKLDFFFRRCKENFRVALIFSPVGVRFKQTLRTFPAFINCTTINWFLDWTPQALASVSNQIVPRKHEIVASVFVDMHESILALNQRYRSELRKSYYVTPTQYLGLLKIFKRIFEERENILRGSIERYVKGVKTLRDSKVKVEEMKERIVLMEPKLEQADRETAVLIETVRSETLVVDKQKALCEKEEEICNGKRDNAQQLQAFCQGELDKVEPLLVKASKNLKSIERNDIDFIKQINNPLPPIKKLFQSLCVLFKAKNIPKKKDPNNPYKKIPDYAPPARQVMAKPIQMLNKMMAYNSESINKMSSSIISDLKGIMKSEHFQIKAISNVSKAAGKICGFIYTIVEIYDKLQIINPKRKAKKEAEKALADAQGILAEKQG